MPSSPEFPIIPCMPTDTCTLTYPEIRVLAMFTRISLGAESLVSDAAVDRKLREVTGSGIDDLLPKAIEWMKRRFSNVGKKAG